LKENFKKKTRRVVKITEDGNPNDRNEIPNHPYPSAPPSQEGNYY
jgi:hypothetical protein